jgi:hypothetical protein
MLYLFKIWVALKKAGGLEKVLMFFYYILMVSLEVIFVLHTAHSLRFLWHVLQKTCPQFSLLNAPWAIFISTIEHKQIGQQNCFFWSSDETIRPLSVSFLKSSNCFEAFSLSLFHFNISKSIFIINDQC